jgi:hypothetical protein
MISLYYGEAGGENGVGGKWLAGKKLQKSVTITEAPKRSELGCRFFAEFL